MWSCHFSRIWHISQLVWINVDHQTKRPSRTLLVDGNSCWMSKLSIDTRVPTRKSWEKLAAAVGTCERVLWQVCHFCHHFSHDCNWRFSQQFRHDFRHHFIQHQHCMIATVTSVSLSHMFTSNHVQLVISHEMWLERISSAPSVDYVQGLSAS